MSGGYVELTPDGKREYQRIYAASSANPDMQSILAAMMMVRELYDKLSLEELLLLVYDTYPEYQKKSDVFEAIRKSKKKLADDLVRKGFISEARHKELIMGT